MKNIFMVLSLLVGIHGQAQTEEFFCYAKKYTADHLRNNPKQSLSSIEINFFNAASDSLDKVMHRDDTMLFIDGCPRGGCDKDKKYFFSSTPKRENAGNRNIFCADFQADGEQDEGCLEVKKSSTRDAIIVSPIKFRYFDGYETQEPSKLVLWYCPGSFSDGEGCAVPTEKIILESNNSADQNYVLERVPCKRPN